MRERQQGFRSGDIGELGCSGHGEEVIEEHSCVTLDGLLAVRAVEDGVVGGVKGEGGPGLGI